MISGNTWRHQTVSGRLGITFYHQHQYIRYCHQYSSSIITVSSQYSTDSLVSIWHRHVTNFCRFWLKKTLMVSLVSIYWAASMSCSTGRTSPRDRPSVQPSRASCPRQPTHCSPATAWTPGKLFATVNYDPGKLFGTIYANVGITFSPLNWGYCCNLQKLQALQVTGFIS